MVSHSNSEGEVGPLDEVEIIVGTYEEFVLGYKLKPSRDKDHEYTLEPSFTNHSHSGSIRAVGVVGKFLASGSTDEAIRLINMNQRVEHGYMQQQTGTITCLKNFGSQFLFSGSTDGTICIWKSGSWICEKTLHAHKGGVTDISIHPSGKLALSVGMDKALKTWNLIKGRTGFVTNLYGVGDVVRWSPEGNYYAVGVFNRLDIYSVQTAKVIYSIQFGKRVSSVCFPSETIVILGGDKDMIEVHDIKTSKKLSEFKAHAIRVKDIKFVEQHNLLVTGSNCDQCVKLWRFSDASYSTAPVVLAEHNTTCRITCITVWSKTILNSHTSESAEAEAEIEKLDDDEKEEIEERDEDDQEKNSQPERGKKKNRKDLKNKSKPNVSSSTESRNSKETKSSNVADNTDPPKKKKKKSV